MERELILERTRAGLEAARCAGRVGGRKRRMTDGKVQAARKLLASGTPPGVTDTKAFAGCWNNITFCIWGRRVELLIDPLTLALNNQVRIFANLLCDGGMLYRGAFAVTAPVTLQ
jgi:hypothetical protein